MPVRRRVVRLFIGMCLLVVSRIEAQPIHDASRSGNLTAIIELLEQGVDVNARNARGSTALHFAALAGHAEIARVLIDTGASLDSKDEVGMAPLHLAARAGQAQLVELLIDEGAEVEARDERAITALGYALMGGHLAVVEALVNRGAEVNSTFYDMVTPLHVAVASGLTEVTEMLLDRGAEVNAVTRSGLTPLDWAPERGHHTLKALLESRGGTAGETRAAVAEWPSVAINFSPGVTRGSRTGGTPVIGISPMPVSQSVTARARCTLLGRDEIDCSDSPIEMAILQHEFDEIARCTFLGVDVEIDMDLVNGYFLFEGPDAESMRVCLVELEGWQTLGALPYAPGAMRHPAFGPFDAHFRSWVDPGTDLTGLGTYYVVTEAGEALDLGSLIVDALNRLDSVEASAGGADTMPADARAKIVYELSSIDETGGVDLVIFIYEPVTNMLKALIELEHLRGYRLRDVIDSAVRYLIRSSVRLEPSPFSNLTRQHEARRRRPEGSIPRLAVRADVDVINAQIPKRWPTTFPHRTIYRAMEYVDFRQLVEVAKENLERYLRDAEQATTREIEVKSLKLAITDITTIFGYETFVHFTVETGRGDVRRLQAYGEDVNYRRSIDYAVADMASRLLNDPEIAAYLEQ